MLTALFGDGWSCKKYFLETQSRRNFHSLRMKCKIYRHSWSKQLPVYCGFHKHANSQLRFSLLSIIITITSNEPWNTKTHKTDRNPPITNHKPWPFEPIKVKFCFLRGPLRWLTAAKNALVSWLLNFTIRMFVKSAVMLTFTLKAQSWNAQKLLVLFCRKTLEWDTLSYYPYSQFNLVFLVYKFNSSIILCSFLFTISF